MARAARSARRRGADLVEFRLDFLARCDGPALARLRRLARSVPAIATLRPVREGGRFRGSEPERRALLEQAAGSGFRYIDLELSIGRARLGRLVRAAKANGTRPVISHHDFQGTPPTARMVRLLARCERAGGIAKAAFSARTEDDTARVVEAARRVRRAAPGAIVIGMGPAGALTRTLAPFLGATLVYAGPNARKATAPGQPSLEELKRCWAPAGGIGRVGASTGLYGILGHPLGHSLSPLVHNAAFRELRLDAAYLPFDAEPGALAPTLRALRAAGLRGANVTIPHKTAVMPLLDRIDDAAQRIGAVNTLVGRNGRMWGYNTDVAGFVGALEAAGVCIRGARALVVGAGGAARAALYGLLANGASVTVANRTRRRAVEMAGRLGGDACAVLDIGSIGAEAERSDIIVNCTPAGMRGFPAACPVPERRIAPGSAVMDMVYNPERTPLLLAAEKRGARTVGGMAMFLGQAAEAFRLWTGKAFPEEAVRRALSHSRLSTN
jgi:shikimate dehydrogenase/3-dehydroquinate dehydratase type I